MKFLEKLNPNNASKIYVTGTIFSVIVLFILTGIVFLSLIANRLDIIMSQPADETYTYFIMIMDRILGCLTILVMIPLTFYQLFSKNKQKIDKTISIIASIIAFSFIFGFSSGQNYYYKKYSQKELQYSKLFCNQTAETKIFDQIIIKKGENPPQMCQTRPTKNKNNFK